MKTFSVSALAALAVQCEPAAAFLAPAAGVAQPEGLQLTGQGLRGSRTSPRAEPPAEEAAYSSSSIFWSAAGVALVASALSNQRKVRVAREGHAGWCGTRMRYANKYGGEKPHPPKWLQITPTRTPGEKTPDGRPIPPWLTLERWNNMNVYYKCRSLKWWNQVFTDDGTLYRDRKLSYRLTTAIEMVLHMEKRYPSKQDNTMVCMICTNLNHRFPDQQVRTTMSLPHGTGKKVKIAVFCPEEEEAEVLEMGAFIAGKTLMEAIDAEKFDFDVLVTKPQMMPRLSKLGRILGPRRLMPSPKSGTVCKDYKEAINEFAGGKTEIRTSRRSQINVPFGKVSFGQAKLEENLNALIQGLADNAPPGAPKEMYKKISICASWGPSVNILQVDYPVVKKKEEMLAEQSFAVEVV